MGKDVPVRTVSISFETREGTALSFDLSRDGRTLVFDLLGQLWTLPAVGGPATPITLAVRDSAEDLDPSFAPDGRSVVFAGERSGRGGLWRLELGADRPRQITSFEGRGWQGQAAWAPDGRRVVFAAVTPSVSEGRVDLSSRLCIVDVLSGTTSCPTIEGLPEPSVRDPAWSPDGGTFAFVNYHALAAVNPDDPTPEGGRIWIAAVEGNAPRPITSDSLRAVGPAWSPGGGRIAFFAPDSAGRTQVWVQAVPGEGTPFPAPFRLTDHADTTPTRIRWTASGESLLYSADGRLWRVPSAGGPAKEISFTARVEFPRRQAALPSVRFPEPGEEHPAKGYMGLALSPDGGTIGSIALGRLWTISADDGDVRPIMEVSFTAHGLAFSPDGGTAAWSEGTWGEEDLRAADLAAGSARELVRLPGREILPSWSPDGQWLAFAHALPDSEFRLRVVAASSLPVTDLARASDLGPIEIPFYGEAAYAPTWSPDSRGLLVHHQEDPELPTEANLVMLDGGRRPLGAFPHAPIFLRWLGDGSLVYVRHDRLWRTKLDQERGMVGEPERLSEDAALYPSASLDGALLYVSADGLRLRRVDGSVRRLGCPLRYRPPVPEPLLIRDVRIIDGTGAPPRERSDLLIEKGRIARLGPVGSLDLEELRARRPGLRVIDAQGRTAIPGLIDLHMHAYEPRILPILLRYGITTIRDQGSAMALTAGHSDAIAAGVYPGPHVSFGAFQFYSDWILDDEEARGIWPEADPGHIERAVRLETAFGGHHLKIRTFLRWDLNARFIEAAHRHGLRTTGHCAHPLLLVAAGSDAKEHIGACGPRGGPVIYEDIVRLYREAGIPVVATIVYWSTAARLGADPELLENPDASRSAADWMLQLEPEDREEFRRGAAHGREGVAKLHRAGVMIGTGSDVHAVPWALHDELEELVRAGLTPLEALRAATGDAARILGAEGDLGTIAIGRRADLVLLDGDPLGDIRVTRRIWRVIMDGRIAADPAGQ